MRPALVPGDEFVASSSRSPQVGDVVAFPRPGRPDFWMVKRMTAGPGDEVDGHGALGRDEAWVLSDNLDATEADSRTMGPIPIDTLEPMVTHLDNATFIEAVGLLSEEEPAFAAIVDRHRLPGFWARPAGFPTLVWLILEQQVSLESGAAMYRRLSELLGEVTPENIAEVGDNGLHRIGVTRQKSSYLTGLASAILDSDLNLDDLWSTGYQEARDALTAIRGIGHWTADAYLLSALGLPDVFPLGDRALQVGTAEVMGIADPLAESDLEMLAQPWKPIRAVAARLIWHSYLSRRDRAEPADPGSVHH